MSNQLTIKEIFKDIKGYENLYQVSNLGKVKSIERLVNHSKGGKQILHERILSPRFSGNEKSRYYCVALCKNGKAKTFQIHRLVAETFIPNLNRLPEVNHKNGNKLDNRTVNLEWCTSKENKIHAFSSGLNKNFGEGHYQQKLNIKKVTEIRNKYIPYKYTITMLATKYSVSRGTIQDVLENKIWRIQ